MVDTTAVPALYIVGILGRWVATWNIPIQLLRLTRDTDVIGTVPSVVWPLQEIPVLLSWFVFLARKRLGKIREGKAVSSSCQLANTLEATLKTIVCAICVVPVLKECLIVSRLKLRENQQGHPTTIFGKLSVRRRFEVQNFRIIFWKISCLPASPRIFKLCPKKVT